MRLQPYSSIILKSDMLDRRFLDDESYTFDALNTGEDYDY